MTNNNILRNIDQTPCEVPCVCRSKRSICHTFSCAMCRDKELQNVQPFMEVRLDRQVFNQSAERVGHQSAHTGELSNLFLGTSSSGIRDNEDRIILIDTVHDSVGNFFGSIDPE